MAEDFERAPLGDRVKTILRYAVKLTLDPGSMGRADVEELRRHGLDDAEIHRVAQITAYFNYINRVADGLGVDPEPEWAGME